MTDGPVSTAELAKRLGEQGLVLLDVRTAEEFAGLTAASCDPRGGRIPGARHVGLSSSVTMICARTRYGTSGEQSRAMTTRSAISRNTADAIAALAKIASPSTGAR